jgi:hypothetical protein
MSQAQAKIDQIIETHDLFPESLQEINFASCLSNRRAGRGQLSFKSRGQNAFLNPTSVSHTQIDI